MSDTLSSTAARAAALVSYRAAGRDHRMHGDPQCFVCQSPSIGTVETGLAKAWTTRAIARKIPKDDPLHRDKNGQPVTEERIMRRINEHFRRGHMPIELQLGRILIVEEAEKAGVDLDTVEGSLVNYFSVLQDILRRGFEAMVDTSTPPSIAETIRVARTLAQVDIVTGANDAAEDMHAAFEAYVRASKAFMDPAAFQEFIGLLNKDPVLRRLSAKYTAEHSADGVMDVESHEVSPAQQDLFSQAALPSPQESL